MKTQNRMDLLKVKSYLRRFRLTLGFFLLGLFIPICIVFILNIGIIFSLPNQFINNTLISNIIEYLSKITENNILVDIFIGHVTVTIIFFAFAQFSYSNQNLPSNLIREYILNSSKTYLFLGIQTGFMSVLAYFTFYGYPQIFTINLLLSVLIISLSVLISIRYFYWISEHISPYGLLKLIIRNLNFYQIELIEKEYIDRIDDYYKRLSETKSNVRIIQDNSFPFDLPGQIDVVTDKTGIIKDIEIAKIANILSQVEGYAYELKICVDVGKYIPTYEPLPDLAPRTVLAKIIPALNTLASSDTVNKKLEGIKHNIEKCFSVDSKGIEYQSNTRHIKNIITVYYHCINSQPAESHLLVEELTSFFVKHFKRNTNKKIIQNTNLSENLLMFFVDCLISEIRVNSLSFKQADAAINMIYLIKNLAPIYKSSKITDKLLYLFHIIIYKILYEATNNQSEISTACLRIHEIAISPIVYGSEVETKEGLINSWKAYYKPLYKVVLNRSTLILYNIIESVNSNNYLLWKKYIRENIQHYLELFSGLMFWPPIDQIAITHTNVFRRYNDQLIYRHAMDIVYLSILTYRQYLEKKLDPQILYDFVFPFAENCNTTDKYYKSSDEILTSLFYDYNFKNPTSHVLGEQFELNRIHEAGTYTPIYGFSDYWIVLSIARKRNNKSYIPATSMVKNINSFQLQEIKWIICKMRNNYLTVVANKLNIPEEYIKEDFYAYYKHLENIFYEMKKHSKYPIEL